MGMPITVEIAAPAANPLIDQVFAYFKAVDRRFSLYKPNSEISAFNAGRLPATTLSAEMREVLDLAERTRRETDGYFEIRRPDGRLDPSGIVKGWAIRNAARLVAAAGIADFLVDAGGDIQCQGRAPDGQPWRIGIRNPFDETQTVKVVQPEGRGMATSGTSARGQHIYDPHRPGRSIDDIASLTVLGPDVLEADRFATAAFAMGEPGISFIEAQPGLEGYLIAADGIATMTSGFRNHVVP